LRAQRETNITERHSVCPFCILLTRSIQGLVAVSAGQHSFSLHLRKYMMDLGDYLERCARPEKVGDFTLLIQGLKCAGAGKCEFAAQYRSLAGWF
jgi:hypothetical protein